MISKIGDMRWEGGVLFYFITIIIIGDVGGEVKEGDIGYIVFTLFL
jgi:hypothetical protein